MKFGPSGHGAGFLGDALSTGQGIAARMRAAAKYPERILIKEKKNRRRKKKKTPFFFSDSPAKGQGSAAKQD